MVIVAGTISPIGASSLRTPQMAFCGEKGRWLLISELRVNWTACTLRVHMLGTKAYTVCGTLDEMHERDSGPIELCTQSVMEI